MIADALSRRPLANVNSCIRNSLIDEIKEHYATDVFLNFLFESFSKEAKIGEKIGKLKSFEVKDAILYYNRRVCIPKFGKHKLNIMNNLHDIPIADHPSF